MKSGTKIRKAIAFFLSVVLCVACFTEIPQYTEPVHAAEEGQRNLQLGSAVLKPLMTSVQEKFMGRDRDFDEKERVTTAQTVYYGKDGSKKWYVIGRDGIGAVKMDGTITLFAVRPLNEESYRESIFSWYDSTRFDNTYANSNVKILTDGYYDSLFTPVEKNRIQTRSLEHGEYSTDYSSLCDGIADLEPVDANLWPLSTKEVDLVGYHYRAGAKDLIDALDYYYFLRSPGASDDRYNCTSYVRAFPETCDNVYPDKGIDIVLYGVPVDNKTKRLINPAFNLDLSSIVFTSAATGSKDSGALGADALWAVRDDYTGDEWKLTVSDPS